jgi:hypothetical protein
MLFILAILLMFSLTKLNPAALSANAMALLAFVALLACNFSFCFSFIFALNAL